MRSNIYLFGSDDAGARRYFSSLFAGSSLKVEEFTSIDRLQKILKIPSDGEKKIVLTGSSLGRITLDKMAVKEAKNIGLTCCSVIENWSWYAERFLGTEGVVFPTLIFVNDDTAAGEAVKAGLPENLLIPLGNPVLENISIASNLQASLGRDDRKALLRKYNIPVDKKLIVFVSEVLRDDFGSGHRSIIGYDEYQVLEDLIEVFDGADQQIVVKKHPAEDVEKYDAISKNLVYLNQISVFDLAKIADSVVGMASMLLLELANLRNDIISYRPQGRNSFIGEKFGIVTSIFKKEDLENLTNVSSCGNQEFRRKFIGSRYKITKFLEKL
jgi:hypothetical protein